MNLKDGTNRLSHNTGKELPLNTTQHLRRAEISLDDAIVLKLVEPLLGRGHTLRMDNLYNSQELAEQLKIKHSTDYVGTLNLNRKNVPKEVQGTKLKKGETIARHSVQVTVQTCRGFLRKARRQRSSHCV
jgi:hypothetical protein